MLAILKMKRVKGFKLKDFFRVDLIFKKFRSTQMYLSFPRGFPENFPLKISLIYPFESSRLPPDIPKLKAL